MPYHLYNAEGARVAKGSLTAFSCDLTQTDSAGVLEQSCQSLPFGNGASCSPAPSSQLFTTYQRDTESGNDYAQARYYASSQGRFLSPDPSGLVSADQSNPQSFNLYSYALNDPLTMVDPTGQHYECAPDKWSNDSTNTLIAGACTWVDDGDVFEGLLRMEWENEMYAAQLQQGQNSDATVTAAKQAPGAPNNATVGPDSQACTKKTATDVIKAALFYDQVDWLAGKLTDALFGSGGYPAADPGMPSVPGSATISAANTTASFIAGSKIAQSYVRQAIKAGGGSISMRRVGNLSGTFGKYAGAIGTALTAYSAYNDYQYCMGR